MLKHTSLIEEKEFLINFLDTASDEEKKHFFYDIIDYEQPDDDDLLYHNYTTQINKYSSDLMKDEEFVLTLVKHDFNRFDLIDQKLFLYFNFVKNFLRTIAKKHYIGNDYNDILPPRMLMRDDVVALLVELGLKLTEYNEITLESPQFQLFCLQNNIRIKKVRDTIFNHKKMVAFNLEKNEDFESYFMLGHLKYDKQIIKIAINLLIKENNPSHNGELQEILKNSRYDKELLKHIRKKDKLLLRNTIFPWSVHYKISPTYIKVILEIILIFLLYRVGMVLF